MKLIVQSLQDFKFALKAREHQIILDQPKDKGTDSGLTPSEIFMGSIGACVLFYAVNFLKRHGVKTDQTELEMDWERLTSPNRYDNISIKIKFPEEIPEELKGHALRAAEQCIVHQTIKSQPEISIEIA